MWIIIRITWLIVLMLLRSWVIIIAVRQMIGVLRIPLSVIPICSVP